MSKNEISLAEAGRRLNKLMAESIPILAFFVSESGADAHLYGFVDSITAEGGLVISSTQGMPSVSSTISVPIGDPVGTGCKFVLGNATDADFALQFGDTALGVLLPSGDVLTIFFTSNSQSHK